MCTENKDLTEKQLDEIMKACATIRDMDKFFEKVAIIENNYEHLKENMEKEEKERKEEIEKVTNNYTSRFQEVNNNIRKLFSKVGDIHISVEKMLKEFRKEVNDKIISIKNKVDNMPNMIKDLLIKKSGAEKKLLWSILILFLSVVIGIVIKEIIGMI